MHNSIIIAAFSIISITAAVRTFNKTLALEPGNWDKYHCIDTEGAIDLLPKCLADCNRHANSNDGCAYDDIPCHCINYNVYSPLVEKCAFPTSMGGEGACTLDDLTVARPIVTALCNFLNFTLYADYYNCDQELSPEKTFCIIEDQEWKANVLDAKR